VKDLFEETSSFDARSRPTIETRRRERVQSVEFVTRREMILIIPTTRRSSKKPRAS
jgi:hypothetical protein